jgi:hypothetical protein
MILRMPCPDADAIFVLSDHEQMSCRQEEISQWAHANGYASENDKAFAIYAEGQQIREWVLLKPQAAVQVPKRTLNQCRLTAEQANDEAIAA